MRDTLLGVSVVKADLETSAEPATLLKALLKQRHLKYETFRDAYAKVASKVAPEDLPPSRAQFYRWIAGHLKGGVPYPDACRVLEVMFPPWTAADLFGPYIPDQHVSASQESATSAVSSGGLLSAVPHSFPASTLDGAWVTCYQFGQEHSRRHHADVSHVTAESDQRVSVANYPPAPRSQGRASPLRNRIDAHLANRHLIGHWKNASDTRYFGAFHLAILPGETVMEGYYTGFASDIQVSTGYWKWIRLEPATLDGVDLSQVTLREPVALYDLVRSHTQYDAPLALAEIREGT